jgi:replicative DNA helicase
MNDFTSNTPAVDAERAILGAILLDNRHYDEAESISSVDFSLSSHQVIFSNMALLMDEGTPVDLVTLHEVMTKRRQLDSCGGPAYLASLTEYLPRTLSIAAYVQIVKDAAQRRALARVCQSVLTMVDDPSNSLDELLAEADTRLLKISAENAVDDETLAQSAQREFDRIMEQRESAKSFVGIPTGLTPLDRYIGGYVEGELTILAGKPGMGKSSLLIQGIVSCGRDGVPVHVFSPEMTRGQILRRCLAVVSGVPFRLLRRPFSLREQDISAIRAAKEQVALWRLIIDDDPTLTITQMISRARISKRRHGTRLVGVDYLQKVRFSSKPEHRHIEVTDAAVKLSNLAKQEQLAVVALSSLTEKGGRMRNAPPVLGDLRQSGDIQYEASTVVFIHREVEEETERIRDDGWCIVAKQRNGVTGQFPMRYTDRLYFEDPNQGIRPAIEQRVLAAGNERFA